MVSEYQIAFTEALRGGRRMQKRIFDTIEERHAHDFGNGKAGLVLYETLLSAVRESGVAEAEAEFENRFLPLLNQMTDQDRMTGTEHRWRGGWIWTSTLCAAAVIFGALILGFDVLKTSTAGWLIPPKPPILDVKAAEPAPPTMTDATQSIEAPVPAAKGTETASDTVTESEPTQAVEQNPSERQ